MQSYILNFITVNNLLLPPTIINTHNITFYIHITKEKFHSLTPPKSIYTKLKTIYLMPVTNNSCTEI